MPLLPHEPVRPAYRRIDTFSTADTETRPEVTFKGDELTVRFTDVTGRPVRLFFTDVVAFRWQCEMPLPPEVRDDAAYEVLSSPLVAELAMNGALAPRAAYRHFLLGFNEVGAALEVVATGMSV